MNFKLHVLTYSLLGLLPFSAWIKETSWTIEMDVLYMDRKGSYAIALVEAMYQEADRDGKPYFHNMYNTYALKEINDKWLVVMDHASTKEKTE